MLKFGQLIALLLIAAWLLIACSSDNNNAATALGVTPTGGEALFIKNGCIACHANEANDETNRIGPSLVGIAAKSAELIKSPTYTGHAQTVEDYLRESILMPNVYLVDGYKPLMPQTYSATLNEELLTELVNYLLDLK